MSEIGEKIQKSLWELQDTEYRDFHAKLIPTVDPENIIGVRTPEVRKLAKEAAKDPRIGDFLAQLPHRYYDENNVHAFVVEQIRDYQKCLAETERFLPYVDNWATCDLISPKSFQKHPAPLLPQIRRWMASTHCYTVRFGIGMLLKFYLDEEFQPEQLAWVAAVSSGEYYVNMMIAWYFATDLAKQYDAAAGSHSGGKPGSVAGNFAV